MQTVADTYIPQAHEEHTARHSCSRRAHRATFPLDAVDILEFLNCVVAPNHAPVNPPAQRCTQLTIPADISCANRADITCATDSVALLALTSSPARIYTTGH
jgi:hypothetical protein